MLSTIQVTRKTGISLELITYYKEKGVFVPKYCSKDGDCSYDKSEVERLEMIVFFHLHGLSIYNISTLLSKNNKVQIQRLMASFNELEKEVAKLIVE